MFSVKNNEISIVRGDTGVFNLKLTNSIGRSQNLEGLSILFTVRKTASAEEPVIQKEIVDGVLNISPDDTSWLEPGRYVYDVQITNAAGEVDTVIPMNTFNILEEVTY